MCEMNRDLFNQNETQTFINNSNEIDYEIVIFQIKIDRDFSQLGSCTISHLYI